MRYKILESNKHTKILGEKNGKLQIEVTCRYCKNTKILEVPVGEYVDFSERRNPSLPSLTDHERLLLGDEWCGLCTTDYEK